MLSKLTRLDQRQFTSQAKSCHNNRMKVLLVYDDYNEMTIIESYLKRVGIDALGISNEHLISENLLGFNPDVVVGSGKTQKVNSLSVSQRLKENHKYHGKSLVILPAKLRPSPDDLLKMKVDGMLEAPVSIEKLLAALSKVTGKDASGYLDKLVKIRQTEGEKAGAPAREKKEVDELALFADEGRRKRYQALTQDLQLDPKQTSHGKTEVVKRQSELQKGWNRDFLDQLDSLKRKFVAALFKKS